MNKLYPVDYITYYNKEDKLPNEVFKSMERTTDLGFSILNLTPDRYNDIKPYHAGLKHIIEISIPKF